MNKSKLILLLLVAMLYSSCSSDEGTEAPIETVNGFSYKDVFYPTNKAFVRDSNVIDNAPSEVRIILSNVNPFETSLQTGGVNYFYFGFEATNIVVGRITPVSKYTIRENSDINDFTVRSGNVILNDNDLRESKIAVSSFVNINAISAGEIDFDFEFVRPDGEIVSGNYKGTYE